MTDATMLRDAEASSAQQAQSSSPVAACTGFGLEVFVRDIEGKPTANVAVQLRRAPSERLRSKTGEDGVARFDGLKGSAFKLFLPMLEEQDWSVAEQEALPADRKSSPAEATWENAPANQERAGRHTIKEGECLTKLALRCGVAPEAIWAANENESLREERDSQHILAPGDEVYVPQPKRRWEPVTLAQRYTIQVRPLERNLRVKFFDEDDEPLANQAYVVTLETASGRVAPDIRDTTDDEGLLDQLVPADTIMAEVRFDEGSSETLYTLRPSWLEPHQTLRGVQARLENLGYSVGDESGELGPATESALLKFQHDQILPATGEADETTVERLVELHG